MKSLEREDHMKNLRVSPSRLARIEPQMRWCLAPFLPVSRWAGCSRKSGLLRVSPVCPQCTKKGVYVPWSLDSPWLRGGGWGVSSPASWVYALAQNERPNEGFSQPVWCLSYASRLTSTRTVTSASSPISSLGKGCCRHLFHLGGILLAVSDYFSNFVEVDSLYLKPLCQLLEVSWQFLADLEYQIPWWNIMGLVLLFWVCQIGRPVELSACCLQPTLSSE